MDPSLEEHLGYQPHMDAKYIERIRRERYLLTRKTWRFMSAAGRKLIPDDVPDPPTDEDLRRIEEHFQEVCRNAESYILYDPDAAREGSETEDDEFDEVQSPGYSSGDGGGGSGGFGTRFIGSHHRTGGSIPLPGQTRLHWTGLPGTGLSMSGNYQHQGSYPTSALPQHKKTHKTQQVLGNSASNRASFLLQSPSAGLAPLNHELRQSRSHPQVPADIHSAAGPIHVPAKRSSSHHLTSSSSPASRHGLAPSVSQENLARRGVSSRPKSSVMPPYYGLGSQPPALRFHRPSIPLGSTGAGYPGEDSFRVSPDPFARFQDSSSLLHQMSGSHDASSPHRSFLSEDHSTAFPASRQAHPTAIPFDRIPFIPNRGVFDPQKGTYVHTTASFDPRIHFDPTLLLFDRGDTSHDFWMSDYPDHPALKLLDWVKLRHIEQPAGGGVGVDRKRMKRVSRGTQTLPIYDPDALGEDGRLKRMHIEEEVLPSERDRESKRSSADSGLSESTLETIKRYFKLVRRNSKSEKHKTDKFKKVNYDHSLRDIKAKGDLSMTVDDGNNKGCQVNEPIPLVSHQGIDGRKASPSRQHSDSTSSPSCPTSPRYSIACDEALPLREGVIKGSDDPHRVSASDTGHQSQSQISSPRSSVEIEFGDEFFPASGASTPLSSPAMVFSPVTSPTPSTTPGVQSGPTSPISKSASFPYGGDAQSLQVAQTQDLLLQHICLQASFLQQQIQQRLASSRTSGGATGLTPSQMSQAVQAAQSIALQMVMEGTLPSAQLPTVPETKKSQQQPSTTQKKSTSSVSSTSSSTVTSQKTVGSTTSGRISARLFKSRSKSNVRSPSASDASHCSWKPVANSPRCWTDGIHQVTLTETTLSSLTEAERRELQHIALAQLRDPSIPLPIQIDIPKGW
ncbi:unnamed protein product [Cyprideis torosa]|uniref:Uncharacterized protein n=1 Tax=Cyprideis torosa TaxID=163714 RepID=A0A7R8WDK3_9CRUS|nr:unnamed protein product [Cyprideis torosa]CAG0894745.1 unnamed protein product [Cyprideis torosa]